MSDLIRREDALEILRLAEHDAEERDWRSGANEIAKLERRINALPAAPDMQAAERERADKLLEALENIARQKKTDELDTDYDVECADFEGGYDAIIDEARTAIREAKEGR